MTALPGVRRKRTALILAMNVLALIAVGAIGLVGATALRNYEGAKKLEQPDTVPLPMTSVGMLAITDDTGRLAGVSLVVSLPGDMPGGYLLPLPTSVDSTLGTGDDRIALTAVFAEGGVEALSLAVEGAVSVTLNFSQVVTPAEAEALFAPVVSVQAQLPRDVRDSVDGTAVVLFPTGAAELTAAQVVQVLTAEVIGDRTIVGGCVFVGLDCQVKAGCECSAAPIGAHLTDDLAVICSGHHDVDETVVLRRRAHHGGAADVDVFYGIFQ